MSTKGTIIIAEVADGTEDIHVYHEVLDAEDNVYLRHCHSDGEHATTGTFAMSREMWDVFVAEIRKGGE